MLSQRESGTENWWKTESLRKYFRIHSDILDFIFPRICLVSGGKIPDLNSNPFVCDSILESLPRLSQAQRSELSSKLNTDLSTSIFTLSSECSMSKIIHAMKYRGFRDAGIFLGKLIGTEIKNQETDMPDFLIPVPLHPGRMRERGYNQSMQICKGISKVTGIRIDGRLVARCRYTLTQTKLGREERAENVKNAFCIAGGREKELSGRSILIADDVITTGSTINEIVKLLRENGCGRLTAVSAAMAI